MGLWWEIHFSHSPSKFIPHLYVDYITLQFLGWGATSEGGSLADKLLELEVSTQKTRTPLKIVFQVPIVSDSVCESAMSSGGVSITSDMLCAGLIRILLIINIIDIINTTIVISIISIIDIDS